MRRIAVMSGMVLMALLLLGCQPAAERGKAPVFVAFYAGGGTGGTFYYIAGGMARIIQKNLPGTNVTVSLGTGGVESVRLLGRKQATLGLTSADTVYNGYHGLQEFTEGKYQDLRALLAGHRTYHQPFVRADSPIRSLAEFKGKRVAVGPAGSTAGVLSDVGLEAYGLRRGTDYKPEYLSYPEQVVALKDKTIDTAWVAGGLPAAAVLDAATSPGIRLISIDESKAKAIAEAHPYWPAAKIPAGTYKGQTDDVLALTQLTVLISHKDIDGELIYSITKAVLEHASELAEIHPAGKEYGLRNAALGIVIPFHPGAEKYLREKGVLK